MASNKIPQQQLAKDRCNTILRETKIHTTRKLAKIISKIITADHIVENESILGKWNANIFYIDRKKCIVFTNAITKYNVIITNFKSSDLNNIKVFFLEALFGQFIYDGIFIEFKQLESIIGNLFFFPTDNDRSTNAFQTNRMLDFEYLKALYNSLEQIPIKKLTNSMNINIFYKGNSRKMSDFTNPIIEMKKIINK